MIEPAAAIKIYNDILGAKGAKGRMIRVVEGAYYEVTIESGGRNFDAMLPVSGTVILAAEPLEELPTVEVER